MQITLIALLHSLLRRKDNFGEEIDVDIHLKANQQWLHAYNMGENDESTDESCKKRMAPIPLKTNEHFVEESRKTR